MSNKFMSWTLKRPSSFIFDEYKKLGSGEPWYSKNYVNGTGGTGYTWDQSPEKSPNWGAGATGFVRMIEKFHDKIDAMGMHEFMICDDGTIANMGFAQVQYPNGYFYYDQTKKVLNAGETDIALPVPTSLRYLMHTYPQIRWSVQILATSNSSGDRVNPLLDNVTNQNNCIRQTKKIVELYKAAGFPITDIEVDCEKTTTRPGDAEKFRDFLVRIKNEACIPTGTKLRVNLFAMTGDFTPAYYGWHDYATLAGGNDSTGKQAIDEFQLMTYDFSWGGSAPGPSTPLDWLESVLKHVNRVLPPDKTYIGNAGYGRRWPLHNRNFGVTLDYKQLMQVQNGMYVHNQDAGNGTWQFNDQDFIPFAGYNDKLSDYQITYLHTYDLFKATMGKLGLYDGGINIELPDGKDYVTNYSNTQKPLFGGPVTVVNSGTATGNTSSGGSVQIATNEINATFPLYICNKGAWAYDSGSGTCIKDQSARGTDGKVTYNFNLPAAGTKKVIAIVSFPYFGSNSVPITVNGTPFTIGGTLPDWYPFITNPSWHYFDCGSYDLGTSNSIVVGKTNDASIGGFIICDSYNQNLIGGDITFPASLQKMKKRSTTKNADGTSQIVDAQFPDNMTLTSEILRRAPRPAIIWEDMFGPHLKGNGFDETTDLTGFPFYRKATANFFSPDSGSTPYSSGGTTYCVDSVVSAGFSQGKWTVHPTIKGITDAYCTCDLVADTTLGSAQLVLNKKFSSNVTIEADIEMTSPNLNPNIGVRFLAQLQGEVGDSYIFLLSWSTNEVKLVHEVQGVSTTIKTVPMSATLQTMKNTRLLLKVLMLNGKVTCYVGDKDYITDFTLPYPVTNGAHGVYMTESVLKVYRLTIASLDRFETMEKIRMLVDGQTYAFGEVARTVGYDEYGYLIYTGKPGNVTEAVRAIPTDPDVNPPQDAPGRAGTIFETEITPEPWNLDYRNIPLASIPMTTGRHDIKVTMLDPGIWLRTFYVGDTQGYSVAYNSDKIGFIRTSQLVLRYNCKGIAMWTLGQEDPQVFEYLPKASS